MLDTSLTGLRITRFMFKGKVRFLPQDRETLRPLIWLCIYEAYLSKKHKSHNTVYDAIQGLGLFVTWARRDGVDLNAMFLAGEMLEERQVNAFGAWLGQRGKIRGDGPPDDKTLNKVLFRTSQAFRWFARQNATFDGRMSDRAVKLKEYQKYIQELFSEQNIKTTKKNEADDLTEEEIRSIEQFLKPENRLKKNPKLHPAQALRDYLVWRLAIEFGFREGEILALRLEDCPHRGQKHMSIVRVEERGKNYVDPRGLYAPRPKTLSRELGFVLENSPIPRLITDYTTKHRRRKVVKHGRKVFQPVLDTPAFLILSHHHDSGNPLSLSSIQDLAAVIRQGTGIKDFHWHIVRHAFFNRAYAAIMDFKEKDNEEYKERVKDLIYWGGWESKKSLNLYVNRARRERAKVALIFYQKERTEWAALK